jgi:hypothetical protein
MVTPLLEAEQKGETGPPHPDCPGRRRLVGTANLALFEHPDQIELLRRRPQLTGHAIDEFAPFHSTRSATCAWP